MNKIKDFITFLDGKKTFIVGGVMLIYALAINDMELMMIALAIMGLRDAINKK